jgi:hypothetical protein
MVFADFPWRGGGFRSGERQCGKILRQSGSRKRWISALITVRFSSFFLLLFDDDLRS